MKKILCWRDYPDFDYILIADESLANEFIFVLDEGTEPFKEAVQLIYEGVVPVSEDVKAYVCQNFDYDQEYHDNSLALYHSERWGDIMLTNYQAHYENCVNPKYHLYPKSGEKTRQEQDDAEITDEEMFDYYYFQEKGDDEYEL